MTGPRRLDPHELGADAPAEVDDALSSAAWLESALDDAPVHPTAGFADRVMAALEHEPTPAAAGFLSPVHRRGFLAGFVDSLRQAWASAFTGGRPALVRASALAYVLAVVLAGTALAGVATVGVGSALGIIGPAATPTVAPPTPAPTTLEQPSGLEPPETTEPDGSEEPGETDEAGSTDDHGGGSGPDATDDHGDDDSSGPGATGSLESDDHSDDHETSTPGPSGTPRQSGTPKPSQTSGSGGDG